MNLSALDAILYPHVSLHDGSVRHPRGRPPWADHENAKYLDWMVGDVATRRYAWERTRSRHAGIVVRPWVAAWEASELLVPTELWSPTLEILWNVGLSGSLTSGRCQAFPLLRDAARALLAFPYCGHYFHIPADALTVFHRVGDPAAVLLAPVVPLYPKTSTEQARQAPPE